MEWNRVTWYSQIIAIILALVIFGVGYWLGGLKGQQPVSQPSGYNPGGPMIPATTTQNGTPIINDVTFACGAGKTARAIFTQNQVQLLLSDGRNLTVPHAVSADGGRYANDDESFVFWTKGNGAFITEGVGKLSTTTFADCTVMPQPE